MISARFLRGYVPAFFVLIILAYVVLFAHLEWLPLHVWDEAHRAVNAQEILKNNNWIVITYNETPDLYGTKPPMLVWLQAICMKIFGIGELAVRMPSALAGVGICITILVGIRNYLKNNWIPIIAILVLLSSWGFVARHGARSGDTDVLMSFFALLFLLNYFRFIEFKKNKYIYYSLFFMALATLTKSIAVFMFVPGLFIFTIYRRKLGMLFQNKHFYLSLLLFVGIVFSYYVTREIRLPGYLSAVWRNEIAGRFFDVNDGHNEDFWFYFEGLIKSRLTLFPIIIGLPLIFFNKDKRLNRLIGYVAILGFCYLLVISSSETKLTWYDIPAYPLLSVLIAIVIYRTLELLLRFLPEKVLLSNIVVYLVLILIFLKPVMDTVNYTFNPELSNGDEAFFQVSNYLREKIESKEVLQNTYVIEAEEMELKDRFPFRLSHILFYTNIINTQGGHVKFKSKEEILVGENIITNSVRYKEYINANFSINVIESYGSVIHCRIMGVNR